MIKNDILEVFFKKIKVFGAVAPSDLSEVGFENSSRQGGKTLL